MIILNSSIIYNKICLEVLINELIARRIAWFLINKNFNNRKKMPSRANLNLKLTFLNEILSEIIVVKILITQFTCFVAITNAICQKRMSFRDGILCKYQRETRTTKLFPCFSSQKFLLESKTSAELTSVNALKTTLLAIVKTLNWH